MIHFRKLVYGPNMILVKESSIPKLLFLEVLNPFYIFQIMSFILWFCDEYYYYAAAILAMSTFGITMTVLQTRKVHNISTITPKCLTTLFLLPESTQIEVYSTQLRFLHGIAAFAKTGNGEFWGWKSTY